MAVLVVGGGISGLVAARELARAGIETVLVEGSPRLGGKVGTEAVDGFVIERGPDSMLATRPAGVGLARALGLGDDLVGVREPRGVFIRRHGRLVPMPAGMGLVLPTRVTPFATTRLFSPLEKARMALDVVLPRLLGTSDVAVGRYLRRRLGAAPVDRLAGPLVGGIYGTPIDELSLDAVVPQLRTAERQHRSLLFAGLAEGRARKALAPVGANAAPAERRDARMSGPGGREARLGLFASLAPGMGAMVDALAVALAGAGAGVRTGVGVVSLRRAGRGVHARFTDGSAGRFDHVVVATPAPAAARLVSEEAPRTAAALARIPHGSSLVVTLAYGRHRVGRPLHGHGYLVPAGESAALAACTWTSEKWPGRAPEGSALLRCFFRDEGDWTAMPDSEAVALARADVERTLRIAGAPELVRVARVGGAMPRYTVGHLDRVAAIEAVAGEWPAVSLVGASYRGVGLPDCIAGATATAARVIDTLRPEAAGEATSPISASGR